MNYSKHISLDSGLLLLCLLFCLCVCLCVCVGVCGGEGGGQYMNLTTHQRPNDTDWNTVNRNTALTTTTQYENNVIIL
jgi:hypothetical protein